VRFPSNRVWGPPVKTTNPEDEADGLFDNLIGECQQGGRHGNAERFGGFEIDNKGKLARLLDREIAGLRAIQNLSGIDARITQLIDRVRRIRHQKPGPSPVRVRANTRLSRCGDQTGDAGHVQDQQRLA
jgi:hypothetical protein